jgi:hypothetical protein
VVVVVSFALSNRVSDPPTASCDEALRSAGTPPVVVVVGATVVVGGGRVVGVVGGDRVVGVVDVVGAGTVLGGTVVGAGAAVVGGVELSGAVVGPDGPGTNANGRYPVSARSSCNPVTLPAPTVKRAESGVSWVSPFSPSCPATRTVTVVSGRKAPAGVNTHWVGVRRSQDPGIAGAMTGGGLVLDTGAESTTTIGVVPATPEEPFAGLNDVTSNGPDSTGVRG